MPGSNPRAIPITGRISSAPVAASACLIPCGLALPFSAANPACSPSRGSAIQISGTGGLTQLVSLRPASTALKSDKARNGIPLLALFLCLLPGPSGPGRSWQDQPSSPEGCAGVSSDEVDGPPNSALRSSAAAVAAADDALSSAVTSSGSDDAGMAKAASAAASAAAS